MNSRAVVAHQMPGRVRLAIAGRRGDSGYFRQLAQRYAGLGSVRRVRINPAAASLVIEYSGPLRQLLRQAEDLFALDGDGAAGSQDGVAAMMEAPPLTLVSGRDLNPLFMAGAAFAAIGLVQSLRGQFMVPAATAFWYATSTLQQAQVLAAAASGENQGPADEEPP